MVSTEAMSVVSVSVVDVVVAVVDVTVAVGAVVVVVGVPVVADSKHLRIKNFFNPVASTPFAWRSDRKTRHVTFFSLSSVTSMGR